MPAALMFMSLLLLTLADRADIVVADFEGKDHGDWSATGDAFGDGPARGAFPGQMLVTGYLGRGLVNSFKGGDRSTGTLVSPTFVIDRNFLNFLIGGGAFPGKTCLELLVEGKVVRSATGPNDKPGGSERLARASWDLREFQGKAAVLRVVDSATGGWGHINVDQIVKSDTSRGDAPTAREIVVAKRYLQIPVAREATERRVKVSAEAKTLHEFTIKLAEHEPDFWVFIDLEGQQGKTLRVEGVLPEASKALENLRQSDSAVPDPGGLYEEAGRPRFHFNSRRGWNNDPNGLVYFKGEYHLFYQHNPYGWDWGNMHWGHAVSPDLVHWTELPIAIYPRTFGDWAFSGSAVVDRENSSGFGNDGEPPLVAAYTSTGRGECIVYSNDRGRTWNEYQGNPVVKHQGRDPKLLWHGPSNQWVMVVYDEPGNSRDLAFYTSHDLKAWSHASRLVGFYECPDLFELPIEGQPGESRWVLSAADGEYLLGQFDGRVFLPDEPIKKAKLWHGEYYAAQTFSDTPDGRRIQIGWNRGVTYPEMPFNQQMSVPCVLTLRRTADGPRLHAEPVKELESLSGQAQSWTDLNLSAGKNPLKISFGDSVEVRIEGEVGSQGVIRLDIRGTPVSYDAARQALQCGKHVAPLATRDGFVSLRILVDRGSIEVFGNDGRVVVTTGIHPSAANPRLTLSTEGSATRIPSLKVTRVHSAWISPGPDVLVPR